MLLVTPKVEMTKEYQVPRDMVLVLDTSGSMREHGKLDQAKKALKYCLNNLDKEDRFALINFATTVNKLQGRACSTPARSRWTRRSKWVDSLEATGGTAINDALAAALELRTKDEGRTFTIVFFTDGQPTIGETEHRQDPQEHLAPRTRPARASSPSAWATTSTPPSSTSWPSETRAVSTYVRPQEDIEAKVSGLYGKISHPVLTNLKLAPTNEVSFSEVYPPQLPDLFHGSS